VAACFVLLIPLSVALGPSTSYLLPRGQLGGAGLETLAQHAQLARVTFGIGILSDLVLLPGIVAVYAALGRLDRAAMPVACGFLGLYVLLDLVVTGPNVVALVSVSQSYATSSGAAQQASFAAATYIRGIVTLSLPLSSGVLSVGILGIGTVVRKRAAVSSVGYLGIVTGIVGLVYGLSQVVPALTAFDGPSAVLELVWFAVMGGMLVKLGRTSGMRAVAPTDGRSPPEPAGSA
jgi:hypothetical protein